MSGRHSMQRILGHCGGALVVLWSVATIAFLMLQLIPGDPAEAALGGPGSQTSAAALEAARQEFGLDRPVIEQYFSYLARILSGDLGVSYAQRLPVTEVISAAFWPTARLALLALMIAWVLTFISLFIASGNSRAARTVVSGLDIIAAAFPNFWVASLLVLLFSSVLGWLPAVSNGTFSGLLLPALALALPIAGYLAQVCRTGADDAKTSAFVANAQARGETEIGLRMRHVLRHGLVPGLNLTAWSLGSLLGGAAVIEVIFARPGLGRTLVNATLSRDVPVVLGVVLCAAACFVIVSLITDLLIARVDPRTALKIEQETHAAPR